MESSGELATNPELVAPDRAQAECGESPVALSKTLPEGNLLGVGTKKTSHFFIRENLKLGLDIAQILVAVVGLWVIFDQLRVMERQLIHAAAASSEQDAATRRALAIAESQARSLSEMVEAMSANERARLYVQRVFIGNGARSPLAGRPLSVVLHFGNWGRTAAEKVTMNSALVTLPKGEVPKPLAPRATTDFLIAPEPAASGYALDVPLTDRGRDVGPLTKELHESIMTGKTWLVLHGRVDYRDFAQQDRSMLFCRAYLPTVPNSETNGMGDWWDCSYLGFKYGELAPNHTLDNRR